MDTLYHLVDDGKIMEQLPLEQFYGPRVIVDLPRGDLGVITADDFEKASPQIRDGDILIVRTGWESKWTVEEYKWKYPYLDESAARWLVSKHIKMIDVDAQSIDPSVKSGLRKAGPIIHKIVLGAGILIGKISPTCQLLQVTGYSRLPFQSESSLEMGEHRGLWRPRTTTADSHRCFRSAS